MSVIEKLQAHLAEARPALNRLQRTVLLEVIHLVREGHLSVELVDHTEFLANTLEVWTRQDGDKLLRRCSLHYTKGPCPDEHMVLSGLQKAHIFQVHVYNDVVEILRQLRQWGSRGVLSVYLSADGTSEEKLEDGNRIQRRVKALSARYRKRIERYIDCQIEVAKLRFALEEALRRHDMESCKRVHRELRRAEDRLKSIEMQEIP